MRSISKDSLCSYYGYPSSPSSNSVLTASNGGGGGGGRLWLMNEIKYQTILLSFLIWVNEVFMNIS